MYRLAVKIVRDENVVSDIIQEIFTSYYEKTQRGISISQCQNWLLRATINKCIDHLKREKRFTDITSLEYLEEEADDFLHLKQQRIVLQKALSLLNTKEMKLAVLYSEGFSYKEMAELIGVNYVSVGKMLARTLKKLKEILKRMNYEMYE